MASRGHSQGTAFTVKLPTIRTERTTKESSPSDVPPVARKLRVLVVEDHGDTRRTLSRLLTHFGHDISVADCVETALDASRGREFDALLSDISLPDGTGYQVVAHVKKQQPLKAIALTALGMESDVKRSREAGFDFHLTKPIDFAELRTVLEEIGC